MNQTQHASWYSEAVLMLSVLSLAGIGIVMVYSASSVLALERYGSEYHFVRKQIIFAGMGILCLVSSRCFPLQWVHNMVYLLLGAAWILLVMLLITPLSLTAGGATRWLKFGGLTFQPAELARLSLIIYLAYSLHKKNERVQEFSVGFVPHVLVYGMFAVLIIQQPDFGSVLILGIITWGMMYIGGVPLKHLLSAAAAAIPAVYYLLFSSSYRVGRWLSFLDPWKYSSSEGYQVIHSLMAFGSGGIWGTGIGKGYQKLFYLPEPHTDFIFSVIGEELGLIGVILIMGLYGVIIWQGFRIALEAQDGFLSLLAAGLTLSIALQISINLGVSLAILPTKGLTLPLISYGGTSLIMNFCLIGLLMNIRSHSKKTKHE